MNPVEVATARHHTYLLLSRLYLHGITADLLPFAAEIPSLAAALPPPFDPDLAAAEYQHVFSFDIYPFESVFRDPTGLLGGYITNQLQELYADVAYNGKDEPGHIGHEFAYLAQLCQNQAEAMQRNPGSVPKYERLQTQMLANHVLHWLPALAVALSFSDSPFYTELGVFALNLVSDHAAELELTHLPDARSNNEILTPDIWNDPQTNLRTIAEFLTTTAYSGLYLGRQTITQLSQEMQLPRGFGSRRLMLANLFHSSAQYEAVPELLAKLAALAEQWHAAYTKQITDSAPHLQPWIEPWLLQAGKTATSLHKMGELAAATLLKT